MLALTAAVVAVVKFIFPRIIKITSVCFLVNNFYSVVIILLSVFGLLSLSVRITIDINIY